MSIGIKPYVNINVDESIVAQELGKEFPDGNVFVTTNDVGIDLILLKNNSKNSRPIRIQVKGSKYHFDKKKGITDQSAGGWIRIGKERVEKYANITDYVVFIIHRIILNKNSPRFDHYFLVIPSKEFLNLSKRYKSTNSRGDYNYYVRYRGGRVFEERNKKFELTKYLNNWGQLK